MAHALLHDIFTPAPPGGVVRALPYRLDTDEILTLDGYFSAFYSAWWAEFCALGAVEAHIGGEGRVRAQAILRSPDGNETQISRADLDLPGILPLGPPPEAGRIFLRLEALTPCRIAGGGYYADTPPLRAPTLSVGICTMNREADLVPTLKTLRDLRARAPWLKRIYVVNHGAPFKDPSLRAAFDDPGFVLIAQPNLGSTGGFARTMRAALEAPDPASHHLVMDDDVTLDPAALERARAFIAHAREDIALGGQMLDRARPAILHEAGGVLAKNHGAVAFGRGVDVSAPQGLDALSAPRRARFNGWWFCLMPLEAIARAGPPLPMFIKYDDISYGDRLCAQGTPMISPPGVAIWHESFSAKAIDWTRYYTMRNWMIHAACATGAERALTARDVGLRLLRLALTHDHQGVVLGLRALEDYAKGPDYCFPDAPAALLEEIRTLATAHRPPAPTPAQCAAARPHPHEKRGRGAVFIELLSLLLRPDMKGPAFCVEERALNWRDFRKAPFITYGVDNAFMRWRASSRRDMAVSLTRIARAALRYALQRGALARQWRNYGRSRAKWR